MGFVHWETTFDSMAGGGGGEQESDQEEQRNSKWEVKEDMTL